MPGRPKFVRMRGKCGRGRESGYTFKRLGQKTMPDGLTPAEVVLNHPRGEPVHFVFVDGGSWGVPDPDGI